MRVKCRSFMLLAVISALFFFPRTVSAAEQEYDFNRNSSVTIEDSSCYAVSGSYTWLKYTPKADGYLTVKASGLYGASEGSKGYLALYSSTKSMILSSKSIFYNTGNKGKPYWYEIAFGLQKGRTYYIRVKGETGVKLSRTFKKVKRKSGESKAKAKNLKKNRKVTGMIPAGVSNADWYKVKITKKQKLRLYYGAKTRGSFKISVYSDRQLFGSRNIYYTQKQQKLTVSLKQTPSSKKAGLDAGTYYIKVERANQDSSGFYKLKWE